MNVDSFYSQYTLSGILKSTSFFYTCYKKQRVYFDIHKFICQTEESVFGMFLREKLTLLYLSKYDFSLHFNYLANNSFACIF